MKLWCDAYLTERSGRRSREECFEFADWALRDFNEAFREEVATLESQVATSEQKVDTFVHHREYSVMIYINHQDTERQPKSISHFKELLGLDKEGNESHSLQNNDDL